MTPSSAPRSAPTSSGAAPRGRELQTWRPPTPNMPMPHWDWNTAAGPPGSRVSALAPLADEPDEPVVLPGPGEAIGFDKHIKALFRHATASP